VGFFVVKGIIGQRYYESDFWPDLARLIFRNQNPAYTIKKRKGKLLSIG
jgi:hypothetical protein